MTEDVDLDLSRPDPSGLRFGYTTGACATAATTAAYGALLTGAWADPVSIELPKAPEGMRRPSFALVEREAGDGWARAAVEKDAGDDPDVTHGALVRSRVRLGPAGSGVRFLAGEGVGTVTKPGLPIPPGAAAINPVPRQMMQAAVAALAARHGGAGDVEVEVSIPGGAALAARTWNPRLGIEGGLSILGTTGIVRPFSCSAWIASIHRGIDVARASGAVHAAGATGATSEQAAQAALGLPDWAMLDMGDFVGGLLKHLAAHPIPRLTIAGGFAKMTKLAQGARDLHSKRSQVDFARLGAWVVAAGGDRAAAEGANTALEVLERLGPERGAALAGVVAAAARDSALGVLRGAPVGVDVMIVARDGRVLARSEARGPDGADG